jgi:hypothetical protein
MTCFLSYLFSYSKYSSLILETRPYRYITSFINVPSNVFSSFNSLILSSHSLSSGCPPSSLLLLVYWSACVHNHVSSTHSYEHIRGIFNKYGSLASNFCLNQALYFLVGGSTCCRGNMQQMAQESVSERLLMGQTDVQWQHHWKNLSMKKFEVWFTFYGQNMFPPPIKINSQLIEMYGEGIMRVQHVRKWGSESENGRMDIHDEDRTGWPNITRKDVNAARVVELLLGQRSSASEIANSSIIWKWMRLFKNSCKCKSSIPITNLTRQGHIVQNVHHQPHCCQNLKSHKLPWS